MRTVRGPTGCRVVCTDCGWEDEETASDKDMLRLSNRARYHAGKEGHRVHVWRETLFVYEPTAGRTELRRRVPKPNREQQ